jgi:hypothetical protein
MRKRGPITREAWRRKMAECEKAANLDEAAASEAPARVTASLVLRTVSELSGVSVDHIRSRAAGQSVVLIRRAITTIALENGCSYASIGRATYRDHSTIIHLSRTEPYASDEAKAELARLIEATRVRVQAFKDGIPPTAQEKVAIPKSRREMAAEKTGVVPRKISPPAPPGARLVPSNAGKSRTGYLNAAGEIVLFETPPPRVTR